jgi:hypothetical protein
MHQHLGSAPLASPSGTRRRPRPALGVGRHKALAGLGLRRQERRGGLLRTLDRPRRTEYGRRNAGRGWPVSPG